MLLYVATCWMTLDQLIFRATFWMLCDVVLFWPRSHNIVRLGHTCQGPGAHKHPHVALKMLRASGQPVHHMSQHHATMLYDVALKCCERLARPLHRTII